MIERTFDRISDLLDEESRLDNCANIMLDSGAFARTDSGSKFFLNELKRKREVNKKLSEYPKEWVEGVKTAIKIINNPDIPCRVPRLQ